ncbi:phosphoglycerate dehydrogenase [Lacticaseibacillus hulanensis]|uniref:phosphoglycerate dehydrogenase n=1 Tax=Lacticaseibacillus hulanensis TaxID=2493111 RepID=UPI000FD8801C|nr:phosphoglycerate dehydrogenase [Lacticaseibacillus hulanensis]
MQKVIVPTVADELTDHYLAKHGYEVLTCPNPGPDEILQLAPDAAAVMMISKKLPNTIYDQMPKLKILARRGVGYDNIDVNYAADRGVWVTNTPGANAHSVAEMALMDMLLLARNFPQVDRKTRANDWGGAYKLLGRDLTSATVGIVGYGAVGREVAKMLHSLGVSVLIYNRTPRESTDGTFVDWDELFSKSDFISLHLAANAETRHVVGAHEFALMQPTAGLVNLARGTIVDEQALISALTSHQIGGAALDVFEQEPLPADSPLLKLPNVVLTPHVGANTEEANRQMALIAAQEIDRVLSGQKPEHPVNRV